MSFPNCMACDDTTDRPHSFCATCAPIMTAHVVSMRTDKGDALAVCPCGWTTSHPWNAEGLTARDAAVIEHWRSVRKVAA